MILAFRIEDNAPWRIIMLDRLKKDLVVFFSLGPNSFSYPRNKAELRINLMISEACEQIKALRSCYSTLSLLYFDLRNSDRLHYIFRFVPFETIDFEQLLHVLNFFKRYFLESAFMRHTDDDSKRSRDDQKPPSFSDFRLQKSSQATTKDEQQLEMLMSLLFKSVSDSNHIVRVLLFFSSRHFADYLLDKQLGAPTHSNFLSFAIYIYDDDDSSDGSVLSSMNDLLERFISINKIQVFSKSRAYRKCFSFRAIEEQEISTPTRDQGKSYRLQGDLATYESSKFVFNWQRRDSRGYYFSSFDHQDYFLELCQAGPNEVEFQYSFSSSDEFFKANQTFDSVIEHYFFKKAPDIQMKEIHNSLLRDPLINFMRMFNHSAIYFLLSDNHIQMKRARLKAYLNIFKTMCEVSDYSYGRFYTDKLDIPILIQVSYHSSVFQKVVIIFLTNLNCQDKFDLIAENIKQKIIDVTNNSFISIPKSFIYFFESTSKGFKFQIPNISFLIRPHETKPKISVIETLNVFEQRIGSLSYFKLEFIMYFVKLLFELGYRLIVDNSYQPPVFVFLKLHSNSAEASITSVATLSFSKKELSFPKVEAVRSTTFVTNPFLPLDEAVKVAIRSENEKIMKYLTILNDHLNVYMISLRSFISNYSSMRLKSLGKVGFFMTEKYYLPYIFAKEAIRKEAIMKEAISKDSLYREVEVGNGEEYGDGLKAIFSKIYEEASAFIDTFSREKESPNTFLSEECFLEKSLSSEEICVNLLKFTDKDLNEKLIERYQEFLIKYSDHYHYSAKAGKNFFYKLANSEMFLIIELIRSSDNDDIKCYFRLIDLNNLREKQDVIIDLVLNKTKSNSDTQNEAKPERATRSSTMISKEQISKETRDWLDLIFYLYVQDILNSDQREISISDSTFEGEEKTQRRFSSRVITNILSKLINQPFKDTVLSLMKKYDDLFRLTMNWFFEPIKHQYYKFKLNRIFLPPKEVTDEIMFSTLFKGISEHISSFRNLMSKYPQDILMIVRIETGLKSGLNFSSFLGINQSQDYKTMIRFTLCPPNKPPFLNLKSRQLNEINDRKVAGSKIDAFHADMLTIMNQRIAFEEELIHEFWKNQLPNIMEMFFNSLILELFFLTKAQGHEMSVFNVV